VFAAGQGGENENGELSSFFEVQLRQAFRNVQTALSAANADMSDVVRLTLLVVNHTQAHLDTYVEVIKSVMGDRPAPACTLIPVPRLALDGMLVEVEATAAVCL
jgi:enamine deaminase RidA (YjgF/YER057c/UK114 family)